LGDGCRCLSEPYVGGDFNAPAAAKARSIARITGVNCEALGTGIQGFVGVVEALCVYGGKLYAGGIFTGAGDATGYGIAMWDGQKWTIPGDGMNEDAEIKCMAVYKGNLYAAGKFKTAGGKPAANIAQWNGAVWSPVGACIDTAGTVLTLLVSKDILYAGGGLKRRVLHLPALWPAGMA